MRAMQSAVQMLCCRRRRPSAEAPCDAHDAGDQEDLPPPLELAPRCEGACAVCQDEGEVLNLACAHTYCSDCVHGQLSARWPGQRVTFGYLNCGVCRRPLEHEELAAELASHRALRQRVADAALEGFREDGLVQEMVQELERYPSEDEMRARAEDIMAVHLCGDCSEPYCAGRVECAAPGEATPRAAAARRCPKCEWAAQGWDKARCMVHGHRFALYKCDSCCDVAVWSCHSNRYCERCHNQASEAKHYPCPGPELCPLGGLHPPNSTGVHGSNDRGSFVIGCRACLGCLQQDEDADFSVGSQFGYPVRDWLSFRSPEEVLKAVGEKELLDRLGTRRGPASAAGLSLHEVAARLLAVEQAEQRALQAGQILADERREAMEREAMERDMMEQRVIDQEAAMVDLEHAEEKLASPLDDVRLAREVREHARGTRALRGQRRRLCLAARAERQAASMLLAKSQVRGRRRGARFAAPRRGGRRKLPAVALVVHRGDLEAELAGGN